MTDTKNDNKRAFLESAVTLLRDGRLIKSSVFLSHTNPSNFVLVSNVYNIFIILIFGTCGHFSSCSFRTS